MTQRRSLDRPWCPARPLLAALALWLLATAQAPAGDWTVFDDPFEEGCDILFRGEIEAGDLTRGLEAASETVFSMQPVMCLDSPGGNLAEVVRYADGGADVMSYGMRIRSGDRCLSSCAILFMFGKSFGGPSGVPYPNRVVEPGASLGFHSPYLTEGGASRAEAAQAFSLAIRVARLLTDSSYAQVGVEGDRAFPEEILRLILGTPPDEMRHVTDLGEIDLLGIEIDGYEALPQVRAARAMGPGDPDGLAATAQRICASSWAMTYRHSLLEEGYDFDVLKTFAEDADGGTVHQVTRHMVPTGFRPEGEDAVTVVLSGPYAVPFRNSLAGELYCRVDLFLDDEGRGISSYAVDFDVIGPDLAGDPARIPVRTPRVDEHEAGLVDIGTRILVAD